MTITFKRPNPGVSEATLAVLEREIGAPLPAPYRAFLAEHEGGFLEPNTFGFPDGSNSDDVQIFYTVEQVLSTLQIRFEESPTGTFPSGLLPIAYSSSGNWLCIKLADGSVWFLDHEIPVNTAEALTALAPSFEAFGALLKPFDATTLDPDEIEGEDEYINVEWARANPDCFTDDYKAAHPEIFG